MLQHYDKNQLLFVGKARDVKLALNSMQKHDKQNQTLQHYLLQRPTMSISIQLEK